VNKSKAKGTAFETKIVNAIKDCGVDAERIALGGANDCGDVVTTMDWLTLVIEAKNYKTFTRKQVDEWRRQATVEAKNYTISRNLGFMNAAQPVLIVSQYGKSFNDSFVHMQEPDGCWMIKYMDEFLNQYVEQYAGRHNGKEE
jgi:predicted GTPase